MTVLFENDELENLIRKYHLTIYRFVPRKIPCFSMVI